MVMGTLFKIMHWPGATVLMYGGLILFGLVFLPLWFLTLRKETKMQLQPMSLGILLLIGSTMLFSFTNIKPSGWYIASVSELSNGIAADVEAHRGINQQLKAKVDAQTVSPAASNALQEMEQSATAVTDYVATLKTMLLKSTDPPAYNEELWLEPRVGASMVPSVTNPIIAMPRAGAPSRSQELKALVQEFSASCANLQLEHAALPQLLLTQQSHKVYHETLTWEQFYFESKPMFVLFANLSQIELAVEQLQAAAYQQTLSQTTS